MNKAVDTKTLIIFGLVFVLMMIVLGGIFSTDTQSTVQAPVKDTKSEMKTIFTDSCVEAGATRTQCNCSFDSVYKELGEQTFMSEAIKFDVSGVMSDTMQNAFVNAIIKCY